jgi:hypothetical protein
MKTKFPLPHVVDYNEKVVWVLCESSITAMGLGALVKKFYPGYVSKIASKEYFQTLNNQKHI